MILSRSFFCWKNRNVRSGTYSSHQWTVQISVIWKPYRVIFTNPHSASLFTFQFSQGIKQIFWKETVKKNQSNLLGEHSNWVSLRLVVCKSWFYLSSLSLDQLIFSLRAQSSTLPWATYEQLKKWNNNDLLILTGNLPLALKGNFFQPQTSETVFNVFLCLPLMRYLARGQNNGRYFVMVKTTVAKN